jgi:hypothetical protein
LLAISSQLDDTAAVGAGAVHLFNARTGQLVRTLHAPNSQPGEEFGANVAAFGDDILVSGGLRDYADYTNVGAAYLFDARTGRLRHTFLNPTPVDEQPGFIFDAFGFNVAFMENGDILLAGGDDNGPGARGAIYVLQGFANRREIAFTEFNEPRLIDNDYTPGPGALEMGFQTTTMDTGGDTPLVVVAETTSTPTSPILVHQSRQATTTFDTVDLTQWDDVSVSLYAQVRETDYETGDYLRIQVTNGTQTIDLINAQGTSAQDPLDALAGEGYQFLSVDIPASWTQATLTITSSSNSSVGAERFDFDSVAFRGMFVIPEPSTIVLVTIGLLCGLRRAVQRAHGRMSKTTI